MSVLKIATVEDIPQIKQMLYLFKEETPYADLPIDEGKLDYEVHSTILADKQKIVTLLAFDEDKPIGIIVGVIQEFPFSWDKFASEKTFWVDPKYRRTGVGSQLYDAFEFWAKNVGAKVIHAGAASEMLERFMESRDYKQMEKVYLKWL